MTTFVPRKASQVRIYRSPDYDFSVLASQPFVRAIATRLGVEDGVTIEPTAAGQTAVVLSQGYLESNGHVIIVDNMKIETRRLVINISGTSEDAETVYGEFADVSNSMLDKMSLPHIPEPVVTVNDSTVGASTEVQLERLLNADMTSAFRRRINSTFASPHAKVSVTPLSLEFQVSYPEVDKELADSRISLNSKQFTIRQVPGQQQPTYLVSGPSTTKSLIRLFESMLKAVEGK